MATMLWLVTFFLCGLARAALEIVPGATWTATNTGEHIQAHGAGIISVDGVYYLIGEDNSGGPAFKNINCYSSTNLVQWTYAGALLTRQNSGDLGPHRRIERPKVLYNSGTGKFVLWMHVDNRNYTEARVGVATADSVCGSYQYHGSWRPLGHQSRDMGLFQDDDGTAYLLSEDRKNGLRIDQLTTDYMNVSKATYLFEDLEAPAMIKKDGLYYMFASNLTGWKPNDNLYATASNIAGPWSTFNTFATPGTDTYKSQISYILQVGNNVMYMGDRWVARNLVASTYIWLPLELNGSNSSMSNYFSWLPSNFEASSSNNTIEASTAQLSNGAEIVSCSGCLGGKAVGYLGGPSNGSALFSNITSSYSNLTTVTIRYENGGPEPRYANISVNGGAPQPIAFLPSFNGSTPHSSVVTVNLDQGQNTISIGSYNSSYGPDINQLLVPAS